jgi:hypothetical protein
MKYSVGCIALICMVVFCCCKENKAPKNAWDAIDAASKVSETRAKVDTNSTAEYKERIKEMPDEEYFAVQLFETPKTFEYVIKMAYGGMKTNGTLIFPNMGIAPKPVLKKGSEPYSCEIGFMDNKNTYREFKLVYNSKTEMGMRTLKRYAVTYDIDSTGK